jgi:PhnB protein
MQRPIPHDQLHATPCLAIRDAARAIEFYARAFGAETTLRLDQPDGRVGHAELKIGAACFALADEFPEFGHVGPQTLGGTTVSLAIYVADVDAFVDRAVAAGATLTRPIKDEFYGDRTAHLVDPFGHRWSFSTRIEDVSADEMKRRMAAL